MALNPAALSALIKSKRLAALGEAAVDNEAMAADCDAIAQAVIEHITAAAVVTTPPGVAVTVAVPAGTGATVAPGVGSVA
jgi:hypothetical protein